MKLSRSFHRSKDLTPHVRSYTTVDSNDPNRIETSKNHTFNPCAPDNPDDKTTACRFSCNVTAKFLFIILSLSYILSFSGGVVWHTINLHLTMYPHCNPAEIIISEFNQVVSTPTATNGNDMSLSAFTPDVFRQQADIPSHTAYLVRRSKNDECKLLRSDGPLAEADHLASVPKDEEEHANTDADQLHVPAGSHLLIDTRNVDSEFLSSKERLATAIVHLIEESENTLLSYHCHSLITMGVSCVGVMLESHISFHTWPKEGVVVMDLFARGTKPLIPILPIIKTLFGISGEEKKEEVELTWSHKLRGFRTGFDPNYKPYENPLDQDLGFDLLGKHDIAMKELSVSEETDFQHVDVYKFINPRMNSLASYQRSLSDGGSYESLHPEHYRPDKILYLDGVQQSTMYGDAAYHEALVHPSMVNHPNPKRVAIIGGGEGATLREVLKHNTVEDVVMVEIDEDLVDLCEEHLPEWSNCADITGSDADSCFDDTRASIVFEDAFKWFIDRFADADTQEGKFDIIIMDALDPGDKKAEIVGRLYNGNQFVDSLFNGLSSEGVLVIQLGESDNNSDPAINVGVSVDMANMMDRLQKVGFESMHIYEEGHSHFFSPWSYLVCFKDSNLRTNWYRNAAQIELELHKRLHRTVSGNPALRFFDGPTMTSYQLPYKSQEMIYCRKQDKPRECDEYLGHNPGHLNIPISHFEAEKNTVRDFAGRGLFASQDMSEWSMFDLHGSAKAFHFLPSTWSTIENLYGWADTNYAEYGFAEGGLCGVVAFVEGYGVGSALFGKQHYTIDSGIHAFCNHGCNGTYTCAVNNAKLTEMNLNVDHGPEVTLKKPIFSPVFERHLRQILAMDIARHQVCVVSATDR